VTWFLRSKIEFDGFQPIIVDDFGASPAGTPDGSQIMQSTALEAVGHYGAPFLRDFRGSNFSVGPDYADGVAGEMFNMRKTSIYGGSNEIQRNIIAKHLLGLPSS